jgi:hypothetical protein
MPTLKFEYIYQLNSLKSSKPVTKFYNIQGNFKRYLEI